MGPRIRIKSQEKIIWTFTQVVDFIIYSVYKKKVQDIRAEVVDKKGIVGVSGLDGSAEPAGLFLLVLVLLVLPQCPS